MERVASRNLLNPFPLALSFSQMAKEAQLMLGFLLRQGFAFNGSWCAVRST